MITSVKNSKEIMKQKKIKWMFSVLIVSIFVGFFAISLSMGGAFLFNSGFSEEGFSYFLKFMKTTFTEPVLLFSRYNVWAGKSFDLIASGDAGAVSYFSILPILLFFISMIIGYLICPHRYESSLLDNNLFVSLKELKRAGFLKGVYSIIGKFDNNFIRLPEQYSTLIYGNPRTLKTNSCSIPAIFSNDTSSIAVIDNEGEIFKKTSGYRSSLGKVYYFDWDRLDKPEMGIFYPRWNPLSEKCLPESASMRDLYFQALSNILIPDIDNEEIDPYWIKKARDVLDVFMEFILCKTIQSNANDYFLSVLSQKNYKLDNSDTEVLKGYYSSMHVKEARRLVKVVENKKINFNNYLPIGSWETIPEAWIGKEASLPMLYDWLYSIKDIDTDIVIKNAIDEIEFFNYSKTLLAEFNKLYAFTTDQRSEIIGIILEFLKIFSIASVREKTMECDFHYYDLRGEFDENNNKFSPISLYLTFDQNSPTNILSKALIEMSVLSMMSFDNKDNKDLYPVSFIFDDFDELPKFNEAIKGPSFGKSQRASFMFLINDMNNMKRMYSQESIDLLNQTTSIKIAKDDEAALYFSKLVNNELLVKQFSDLGDKEKLKKEYQMIFIDKFGKRSIVANAPVYFVEKPMMVLSEIEYSAFVNSADLEQRLYDGAPSFKPDELVYSTDDEIEEEQAEEIIEIDDDADIEEEVGEVDFDEDDDADIEEIENLEEDDNRDPQLEEDVESKKEAIESFKKQVIKEECEKIDIENEILEGDINFEEEISLLDEENEIDELDVEDELSDLLEDVEFSIDVKNDVISTQSDLGESDFKYEPVSKEVKNISDEVDVLDESLINEEKDVIDKAEDFFIDKSDIVKNDNIEDAKDDIENRLDIENLSILDNQDLVGGMSEEFLIDDPVAIDKELNQISRVFSTKSKKERKANLDNLESFRRLHKNVSSLEVKSVGKKEENLIVSNEENLEKVKSELKVNEDAWWMEEDVFSVENRILENPFSKKVKRKKEETTEDYLNDSISSKRKLIDKKIDLEDIDIDE